MPQPPAPPAKRPEQVIREAVNDVTVSMVRTGFEALDSFAENATNELKKAIIRGISGQRKDRRA